MMSQQESPARPLKIITGADDFGCALKDSLVSHLSSNNIQVQDLGTNNYYSVGEQVGHIVSQAKTQDPDVETLGLVACGTGVGVSIFTNKFPGVYATTCLTPEEAVNARSINNCTCLTHDHWITNRSMNTPPETAVEILEKFLNTPFKSPCPASGLNPWPSEIESFLDGSLGEMQDIGKSCVDSSNFDVPCSLCSLVKTRDEKESEEFKAIEIIPGGSMKIIRETPTSAIVRFKAGSVEPAHHHTFGHDLVVLKGRKSVWNLTKKERFDLVVGDYLFTPKDDVHRVKYHEDTEFFIKWDGHWDMFFDEELAAGKAATENEN